MKNLVCFLFGCDCTGYACSRCASHVHDSAYTSVSLTDRLVHAFMGMFRKGQGEEILGGMSMFGRID